MTGRNFAAQRALPLGPNADRPVARGGKRVSSRPAQLLLSRWCPRIQFNATRNIKRVVSKNVANKGIALLDPLARRGANVEVGHRKPCEVINLHVIEDQMRLNSDGAVAPEDLGASTGTFRNYARMAGAPRTLRSCLITQTKAI